MFFQNLPKKALITTATLLVLTGINGLSLSDACATITHHPTPIQHQPQERHPSTIRLEVVKIVPSTGYVTIRLWDTNRKKPILLSDLREMHTQKIHVLIVDESLDDYQHVHPRKTQTPGEYEFIWRPINKFAHYRIWADIVSNSGQQEYLMAELTQGKKDFTPTNRSTNFEKIVSGYRFQLSFGKRRLSVGNPSLAKIDILDSHGKPVRNLQPVMGAYAHIVGFYDDFRTILHAHPMGKEPSKASDRGGYQLSFHLEPQKAGFVKLFVQVKIHDKMLFVPFNLYISPRG